MTLSRFADTFGVVEPKSQWSATYRRIFNTFPLYDSFDDSRQNRRYDLPPREDVEYAEILPRAQSAPPTVAPPPPPPPTVSTASLSPQSILRSHDSSPRSRKRVSICDVIHDSQLPQELAIRRAINREDVEDFLVELAKREFPEGGHVEVTSQPPKNACFESLMKMSTEDKTIYVSLKQLLSVADSREKLRSDGENEKRMGPEKKPVTRLDSNATTTSFASTRTSLFEEMKAVKGLLKLDETSRETPRREEQMAKEEEEYSQNSPGKESRAWTTSKTWTMPQGIDSHHHKEDFSKKPKNPSHPQLIAIVREKVETGQILGIPRSEKRKNSSDWPDIFVLKTFHCATVQPMEEKFFRNLLAGNEMEELQVKICEEYSAYERILERVRVAPGAYTSLAHSICLADAFWFHARILPESSEKENFYRQAIDEYSSLLQRAEKALPSDNISLLQVAEKTATLLAESKNFDPDLVMRTAFLVDRAERALEEKPETSARRRAKRIKARLAEINTHCHILV